MWLILALGSSLFAALTSILAKIGVDGVNSNLATAIRTGVVLLMSWGMVFLTNTQTGLADITRRSWLFLILSGLATGASWLCYYKALQMGEASKVVPIDKLSILVTVAFSAIVFKEKLSKKPIGIASVYPYASADRSPTPWEIRNLFPPRMWLYCCPKGSPMAFTQTRPVCFP